MLNKLRTCTGFMIALGLTGTAWSAEGPLLIKSSGGGFVPPEYQQNELCTVYSDHIDISMQFGKATIIETRKITGGQSLEALIKSAASAPLKAEGITPCDAPTTSITAVVPGASENQKYLKLYFTGTCGSPRETRDGIAAGQLMAFINRYCSTTH